MTRIVVHPQEQRVALGRVGVLRQGVLEGGDELVAMQGHHPVIMIRCTCGLHRITGCLSCYAAGDAHKPGRAHPELQAGLLWLNSVRINMRDEVPAQPMPWDMRAKAAGTLVHAGYAA